MTLLAAIPIIIETATKVFGAGVQLSQYFHDLHASLSQTEEWSTDHHAAWRFALITEGHDPDWRPDPPIAA